MIEHSKVLDDQLCRQSCKKQVRELVHKNPLGLTVVQDRVQVGGVKHDGACESPFLVVSLIVLDLDHKIIETPIGVDF
jgi:hypothetical protein